MEPEKPQPQRQEPSMQRPEPARMTPERPQPPRDARDAGDNQTGSPNKPKDDGPKKSSFGTGTLLKILAVVVLAVVGWFYFGNSSKAPLNAEEASPNYQKNKNFDPHTPAVFAAQDRDQARTEAVKAAAIQGDPLPGVTNPSPQFIEAAKKGDVTFYAVRLYDTCAEDGDVVTLRVPIGGDIGPIPLTIAGTVISVPVVAGQPAQVTIVGVKDGVGGITMGAQSSGGTWLSSVLPEGGTETMPLSVQ